MIALLIFESEYWRLAVLFDMNFADYFTYKICRNKQLSHLGWLFTFAWENSQESLLLIFGCILPKCMVFYIARDLRKLVHITTLVIVDQDIVKAGLEDLHRHYYMIQLLRDHILR